MKIILIVWRIFKGEIILKLMGPIILFLVYFHSFLYVSPHLFSIFLQLNIFIFTLFLTYFHSFILFFSFLTNRALASNYEGRK